MLSPNKTTPDYFSMSNDQLLIEFINCKDQILKALIGDLFNKRINQHQLELKNEHYKKLLTSDILRDVALFDYCSYLVKFKKDIPEDLNTYSIFTNIKKYTEDEINTARSFNRTLKSRKNRLYKYISSLFNAGPCLFGTLTFTEEILNNTSKQTRRSYVTRFLKEHYP